MADDDDPRNHPDPDLMSQEERDRYAMRIAERMDKLVSMFVEVELPPGVQYVFIMGFKDRVGAMFSNVEDREVMLNFLSTAQHKLKQ